MATPNSSAGDFEEEDASSKSAANSTPSFEERVNAAVKEMKQKEDGTWELPEGIEDDEALKYAVNAERRRRDTQSALAKTDHELRATKAQQEKLVSKLRESFAPSLTAEQVEELEDLRSSDPDAWRVKMNEYEQEASKAFEKEISELGYDEDEVQELATRQALLDEHNANNPELQLNDEVFENDLPPRITGKLANGEISFAEFLKEAAAFLGGSKKVAGTDDEDEEPNLGKAGGGSAPSDAAESGNDEVEYANTIF